MRNLKKPLTFDSKVIVDRKVCADCSFEVKDFLKVGGKRGAALSAVAYWVKESGVFPLEALYKVVEDSKYATSLQKAIKSEEELREVVYSYVPKTNRKKLL
jgi:hypothetical protein